MAGFVLLSPLVWVSAQDLPAKIDGQSAPYSLRVKSDLVVLDVVVTDKKGAPVTGLTRDDFRVYENKVPQTIAAFEAPAARLAVQPASYAAIHSTSDLDRLAPQAPVSVLVLDEITTKFEDEAFARFAIQKYLKGEGDVLAEPTLLMAVNLEQQTVLRDYTTSKREILEAMDRHWAVSDARRQNPNYQGQQAMASLLSLTAVAEAMAGHGGHKNILWIGRGFPDLNWDAYPASTVQELKQAIATCTNRLREARVTLYSVDPASMPPGQPVTHTDDPQMFYETGDTSGQIHNPFGGQEDFDELARATGGRAMHGKAAVDKEIAESVAYGRDFYTIAYKPMNATGEAREYRSTEVAMKDPKLLANGPAGYFTGTATSTGDEMGKVPEAASELGVAADGLMVYDGIPLTVERVAGDPNKFRVGFAASALGWTPAGEQDQGEISVLVSSYDAKGKLVHREAKVIGLVRPRLAAGKGDDRVVHLLTGISTAAPVVRVRVVVRSDGNGRIGAGNFWLTGDPASGARR